MHQLSKLKYSLFIWALLGSVSAQADPNDEQPYNPGYRAYSDYPVSMPAEIGGGRLSSPPSMGNIGPYKKDLMKRLAANFPIVSDEILPTILITINHDGKLSKVELYDSYDDKKLVKAALYAASVTEYAPLPDWYKGQDVTFKVNMSSVQSLK